jgi:hypothetical protein
MGVKSHGGAFYFAPFVDDKTRFTTVAFLRTRDLAPTKFDEFRAWSCNLHDTTIKFLRLDGSGENTSKLFHALLAKHGIQPEYTAPHSSFQNGVAERKIRSLTQMARCMLLFCGLPGEWWADAVSFANYVSNRIPTSAVKNITPFEDFYHQKPDLSDIHIFGCPAQVLIEHHKPAKFAPRSRFCVYLGPNPSGMGNRFFDPSTRRVIVSRSATFYEQYPPITGAIQRPISFPGKFLPNLVFPKVDFVNDLPTTQVSRPALQDKPPDASVVDGGKETSRLAVPIHSSVEVSIANPSFLPPIQPSVRPSDVSRALLPSVVIEPLHIPAPPPLPSTSKSASAQFQLLTTQDTVLDRSQRPRIPPDYFVPPPHHALITATEPHSLKEALAAPDAAKWKQAMDEEFRALIGNSTWDLVPRPKSRHPIGTKWVYKLKLKADGSIERYKARLVAKGYRQRKGLDFDEVFAPVIRMTSIRVFLALAAALGFIVYQLDINSAYLKGIIDVEIYMEQPPGYVDSAYPDHVCRLQKGIYGLKQAGRIWNAVINEFLLELGFSRSTADPCVYILFRSDGPLLVGLYVDDMPFAGTPTAIAWFKQAVANRFDYKDIGVANFLVGIQLTQSDRGITLSQSTYIHKLVNDLGLSQCRRISVPISGGDIGELDTSTDTEPVDPTIYRNIIGRLMYAMVATRPDIAYAVSTLGKYASKPNSTHLRVAKKLVCYLHHTANSTITYPKGTKQVTLTGFSDADWANDRLDRRSITGYIFQVNGAPISWCSKKQQTVALSSTEAEYMAACQATKEAIWLRRLLSDFGHPQSSPTILNEDNQSTIALAKNPIHHNRTKHIDVQHHFVREKVASGEIQIVYCQSADQLADLMTKALTKDKFLHLLGLLRLRPSS